jgi:Tol biopolymer transport system component
MLRSKSHQTYNGHVMRALIASLLIAMTIAQRAPSEGVQSSSPILPPSPARIVFERNMIFPAYMMDAPTPTNIFVASLSAPGEEIQLTKDDRSEDPVWSPDGTKIAFIHLDEGVGGSKKRNHASEIVEMDGDGKNAKRLASFQSYPVPTLAWSPDGKSLAVGGVRRESSEIGHRISEESLYVLDAVSDGTPRLLVENGSSPSWSPDGTQIAYTCSSEVKPGKYGVSVCIVAVPSSSEPHVVAENAWNPLWAPNGGHIAYLTRPKENNQLFICNVDGSAKVPFSDGKRDVQSIVWAPDGKRIAFTERHPMEDEVVPSGPLHVRDAPRIFVTSVDGTRIGPFGEKERLWCHDLSWSGDGRLIAAICASGLWDDKTRVQRGATSLFVLDSANLKSKPRLIAEKVQRAVFSPR